MRLSIILIVCLCFFSAYGTDGFINELSNNLKRVKGLSADFSQKRAFKGTKTTFVTTGKLVVENSKRLLWEVKSPIWCISIFTTEKFEQWDDLSKKRIKVLVSDIPWMGEIFMQFSVWTTGDLQTLKSSYIISKVGARTLHLEPTKSFQKKYMKSIEMTFTESLTSVEKVVINEVCGDRVEMEFSNILLNPQIEESRWLLPEK